MGSMHRYETINVHLFFFQFFTLSTEYSTRPELYMVPTCIINHIWKWIHAGYGYLIMFIKKKACISAFSQTKHINKLASILYGCFEIRFCCKFVQPNLQETIPHYILGMIALLETRNWISCPRHGLPKVRNSSVFKQACPF